MSESPALVIFVLTKMEYYLPLAHAYTAITGHCTCASSVVIVLAQDDDFASSPLGAACRENQLEVVKALIENGAVVNYRDKVCLDSILAMATHCTYA